MTTFKEKWEMQVRQTFGLPYSCTRNMEQLLQFSKKVQQSCTCGGKKRHWFFSTKNKESLIVFLLILYSFLFLLHSEIIQALIHETFRDKILIIFFHLFLLFPILFKPEMMSQNFLGPQWDFSHGFLRSELILGVSVGLHCDQHFCQLNAVGVSALEIYTIK